MKRLFMLLLASFFLLNACSSKLAYNNIDWLLYWYLDDYIELSREQKGLLDSKLDGWLVWHRSRELMEYQGHLHALQQQIKRDEIPAEQWLQHFDLGRQHWLRARDKISPELIGMAPTLSNAQITQLFDTLEKQNTEREEQRAKKSPEQRRKDSREDIEGQLKNWIGRLSDEQKLIVAGYATQLESSFDDWMRYRRNIQNKAKTMLLQRHDNPNFQTELLYLIQHPEVFQPQTYIDKSVTNRHVFAALLEKISVSLSQKQSKKLIKELQSWIEDLDDLVED
ncbi:MAG: hypothetical protein ACI8Z9_000748 [Paraglaciecola sp.]|jgi:hypothetical protein